MPKAVEDRGGGGDVQDVAANRISRLGRLQESIHIRLRVTMDTLITKRQCLLCTRENHSAPATVTSCATIA